MKNRMTQELVNQALMSAIWTRKPPRGLLWHTDRGSQYASKSHRDLLKEYGFKQSMSRKGNCWDNAPMERFFRSLKTEWIPTIGYKNFNEAKNYDININSNVITNATFCRYEAVRLLESLNLNLID